MKKLLIGIATAALLAGSATVASAGGWDHKAHPLLAGVQEPPPSPQIPVAKQLELLGKCIQQAKLRQEKFGIPISVTWDSPFLCRAHGGFQQTGELH